MFANFIYLLVALVLYSTCDYPGADVAIPDYGMGIALGLVALFWWGCRFFFNRLEKKIKHGFVPELNISMDKLIARFSMGALCLFAVDLYLLHLNQLLADFKIFKIFPTLEALVFMGLFLLYLVIVWACAWPVQKKYFSGTLSQKEFIRSNISFSLPALLPWFLVSILADLLELLPFEQPGAFLATPLGEVVYVLTFMVAIAALGPFLIQKVWGCHSLNPGPIRQRIEQLCRRAGVKYRDILKWELFGGSMITAGVMGIWGRFRYILVTPSLMSLLGNGELDAVIVHEIGHVENRHIHFYLLFFVGYIACIYAFLDPLIMIIVSGPMLEVMAFAGISREAMMTLVLSCVLILLFVLYFRYGFGFYMRNFERQADLHVYQYLPNARSMITTFHKIAAHSHQPWDKPNWHHFSIKERVHFLARCEADHLLIKGHHKKVRAMMWGYIVFLAGVCILAYYLNFGPGKVGINQYVTEKIVLQNLEQRGNDLEAQLLAGDYYYETGAFDKAIVFYQTAIENDPDNAHALNNLAWLYATCKDFSHRNPPRALTLAKQAVSVDRSPHVLDTFAEALFINGHLEQALKVAKQALETAEDRRDYYQEQVARFKKSLSI
ncbi:Zn-dependent protease with chaperone function [Desulfocicer vacuolatum DSM 3385]|uniref:Zn-dependent protease with chaperone function n=1 Tax=Desulfocicer vacuolatum DSM 3385 TaxID=1121400 RepID=A0A1W2AE65_9BACT|nr:M48 family metallopeptidase [Desulfocicer vacuolatum]SMC58893.1 Zn-dependent protease with chaperone function [Desulfocicer vacuolatum DSM 3385]